MVNGLCVSSEVIGNYTACQYFGMTGLFAKEIKEVLGSPVLQGWYFMKTYCLHGKHILVLNDVEPVDNQDHRF